LTINYYEPSEGLAHHTDNPKIIKELVVGKAHIRKVIPILLGFSLLSPCIMTFTHTKTKRVEEVVLEPRTVMIQRGEVRYDWTHGIEPGHTKTVWKGEKHANCIVERRS
jgi:alkylated DNA repair dioxygenase AlkB